MQKRGKVKIEELKKELKEVARESESYEQIIDQIVIYVVKNFRLKKRSSNA